MTKFINIVDLRITYFKNRFIKCIDRMKKQIFVPVSVDNQLTTLP